MGGAGPGGSAGPGGCAGGGGAVPTGVIASPALVTGSHGTRGGAVYRGTAGRGAVLPGTISLPVASAAPPMVVSLPTCRAATVTCVPAVMIQTIHVPPVPLLHLVETLPLPGGQSAVRPQAVLGGLDAALFPFEIPGLAGRQGPGVNPMLNAVLPPILPVVELGIIGIAAAMAGVVAIPAGVVMAAPAVVIVGRPSLRRSGRYASGGQCPGWPGSPSG